MSLTMIGELLKSRVTHIFLMLLGVGLFVYFICENYHLSRIASQYKSATCTVESAQVILHLTRDSDSGVVARTNYFPEITYRYDFGGVDYVGTVYRHGENGMKREEVEKVVSQYSPGQISQCWVDPKEPSKAVLNKESDHRTLYNLALGGLAAFLLGAAGFAFLQFVIHGPARLTP